MPVQPQGWERAAGCHQRLMELSHLAAPAGLLGRLIPSDTCHCRGLGRALLSPSPAGGREGQGQQLALGFGQVADVRRGIRHS